MRTFQFWVRCPMSARIKGHDYSGSVCGGSDVSEALAQAEAAQRWQLVCDRIAHGRKPPAETYESDIIEEVLLRPGSEVVVTRNRYGAEILNCTDLVIVDVDHVARSLWAQLFSFGKRTDLVADITRKIHDMLQRRHPVLQGARIYRTPKGARVLAKCTETDPRSPAMHKLMDELGSDWLYALLCAKQRCFRARLTAKPSRIKMKSLNQRWPITAEQRPHRESWLQQYRAASAAFAACRFVEAVGHAPASATVTFHDQASRALTDLPLA